MRSSHYAARPRKSRPRLPLAKRIALAASFAATTVHYEPAADYDSTVEWAFLALGHPKIYKR